MTTAGADGTKVQEEDGSVSLQRNDPSAIDLWIVDLDRWSDVGTGAGPVSAPDRAEAARIRDPVTARRLLSRRSATRHVLSNVLGLPADEVMLVRSCPRCGSTEHGRPTVPGTSLGFSVAASGAIAIVAVIRPGAHRSYGESHDESRGEIGIGVDVESIVPRAVLPLAALTRVEQAALHALPSAERVVGFLQIWTAKEAVLKAGGRTIADDPSILEAGELLASDRGNVEGFGIQWCVQRVTVPAPRAIPVIVSVADRAGTSVHVHVGVGDTAE